MDLDEVGESLDLNLLVFEDVGISGGIVDQEKRKGEDAKHAKLFLGQHKGRILDVGRALVDDQHQEIVVTVF